VNSKKKKGLGKGLSALFGDQKKPENKGKIEQNSQKALIGEIGRLSRAMGSAKGDRGGPLPLLNKTGIASTKVFRALYNRLNPDGGSELKSKKSFVE